MKQKINLFDVLPKKVKVPLSWTDMVMGSIGFVVMLSVLSAFYSYQTRSLTMKLNKVLAAQQISKDKIAAFSKKSPQKVKEYDDLTARIAQLQKEVSVREKMLSVFQSSDFDTSKGFSKYFDAFAQDIVPDVWLTSISLVDRGRRFVLNGNALNARDILSFVQRLYNNPVFVEQRFALAEMHGAASAPTGEAGNNEPIAFTVRTQGE